MSNITKQEKSEVLFKTYKKSWVAYAKTLVFIGLLYCVAFALTPISLASSFISWLVFGLFILWAIYRILNIKNETLYTNGDGVWVDFGFLPWRKGARGVRWEDMDMARFRGGFLSWIFNSHTVVVTHKYTKDSEFFMTDVSHGKEALAHIEEMRKTYTKRWGSNES